MFESEPTFAAVPRGRLALGACRCSAIAGGALSSSRRRRSAYLLFGLNNLFRAFLRFGVGNGLFPLFLFVLILFARFGCIFCLLVGFLATAVLFVSSRLFVCPLTEQLFWTEQPFFER